MTFRGLVLLGSLLGVVAVGGVAHAKLFQNAYVSFELPPNWNCKLEASEWICESDFAARTKEAIIILTAKEVGSSDSLTAYTTYLQTPRIIPGRGGMPMKSQVVLVKQRMIANQMWIDGMQEGSEVSLYFTRYLATVRDSIAILVTFSAHKSHYPKYSNDFIHAIESLRVVATKDTLHNNGGGIVSADAGGRGTLGQETGGGYAVIDDLQTTTAPRGKGGGVLTILAIALLILGAGGYYYVRLNEKKSKKASRSKPKSKPKAK